MNKKYIVMGVSGCGKSLIGALLAEKLQVPFFDGDDFHPPENVEKMRQGSPLNDEDRHGWLQTLNQLIISEASLVLACSGLKPQYRELLCSNNDAQLIYLKGDIETIWSRHSSRKGHYFNGREMLENQFQQLVAPQPGEAIEISIDQSAEGVLADILKALAISSETVS
ncbi:gluconokinase [Amphritea atlantica]|uniref:Gluconokinase n=1 Tax=Amphritea atlantica TaxID=355243 RepID=A0A1H9JSK8_9GAMM|nr:gluconokinase [Amphritea atlantica]SEQ89981.1 gluconokinase [Amphritea atlantica]